MSNNAVNAYANGEKPLSRWTRSAILNAIAGMILDNDLPEEIISDIDAMRTDDLRQFLVPSSWHHTSKCYNRTIFYSVSDESILSHFGYRTVVAAVRSDGSEVFGSFTNRDPVTYKLTTFTTIDGVTFPRSDIVSTKLAYIKK